MKLIRNIDVKMNQSELVHINYRNICTNSSIGTTIDGTHSRMLSSTMQNTKKINFGIDETDENCLFSPLAVKQ